MQLKQNRTIALGTAGALLLTTFGGLHTPVAQAGANTWRNLALGAGVITGYGLLKHKRSVAVLGGVATGLSYLKYRKEKKSEANRRAAATTYYRSSAYRSSANYVAPRRNYSVSPYRYTRAHSYHHAAYVAPSHHVYHRAAYPYHPWLHKAVPMAAIKPATHVKPVLVAAPVKPTLAPRALAAAAPLAAAVPLAATAPLAAASAAPVVAPATASGVSPLSFGFGFLAALMGIGLGFGMAHFMRRDPRPTTEADYPRFDPQRRGA